MDVIVMDDGAPLFSASAAEREGVDTMTSRVAKPKLVIMRRQSTTTAARQQFSPRVVLPALFHSPGTSSLAFMKSRR
jgi:hypothetical protein